MTLRSSLGSSLAIAHASLHAAAFIGEFLQRLPTALEGPYWAQFCVNVEHAFAADVIFPLHDITCCLACSVSRSITAVCSGVVKHAEVAIQLVRWSLPLSAGFFFGDPVSTSLNFAMMSTLIKDVSRLGLSAWSLGLVS